MTSSSGGSARFCDEDEFYDGVVEMCSKCSDVCAVPNDFCDVNCPGYTRHMIGFRPTESRHVVTSPTVVKTASRGRDSLDALLTKPLFWTSLISLSISVVATSVLVALCVCRGRRPATPLRPRSRQLAHVAGPPPHDRLTAAARHNGMTLPHCRLADDNIYSESQPCRGHVMLPVSKQDSCAAEDECVSLCNVGNSRELTCNISGFTDHPQSSWISWIATEQSLSCHNAGRRQDEIASDDVTGLKMVCRALDERRHDSLCEREGSEAGGMSRCREVTCQTDSAASCLMYRYPQQPTDIVNGDDRDGPVQDDDMQLKLDDAGHVTSLQLSASESPVSLSSLQCAS